MSHLKNSNFFIKCFSVLIITVCFIVFIEFTFLALSKITNLYYFESRKESDFRFDKKYNLDFPKFGKNIDNSLVKKVAVFGGSSANGYASAISFSDYLANSDFALNNFQIKNYAQNGAPFYNYQSEILKKVINHYDIIIIYSGHNAFYTGQYEQEKY